MQIALHAKRFACIEPCRREAELPLTVGGIARDGLLRKGDRIPIGVGRGLQIAFRLPDLPDLVHRLRSPEQLIAAERLGRHRVEVGRRLATNLFEQLEPADLLQPGSQVAQHETNERLRLLTAAIGLLARGNGDRALSRQIDRVFRRAEHEKHDRGGDRKPDQPPPRFASNPPESLGRFDGSGALRRGSRLEALDQRREVGVQAGHGRRRADLRPGEQRRVVERRVVRRLSGEQLLEQEAERIHVAGRRRDVAGRLLGAHVADRARDHAVNRVKPRSLLDVPQPTPRRRHAPRAEARASFARGRRNGCLMAAATERASPKSSTFTTPLSVIITFPGLRSRWTMPAAWVTTRTSAICSAIFNLADQSSPAWSARRRFLPSMSSRISQSRCSSSM